MKKAVTNLLVMVKAYRQSQSVIFFSTQEEADTRIILHCLYACKQDNSRHITVRSQDTDVFLLLLAFSDAIQSTVYFDTGHGAKRRQINISGLADTFSKSVRDAILGIHSFTGCDSTSCFSGKGKVRPLKLMMNNTELISVFARLGTSVQVSDHDLQVLESFVCELQCNPLISTFYIYRHFSISTRFQIPEFFLHYLY